MFSGRQTDGKLDFKAGFGEYAQCTVPNTNSTMDARTEDCIVMLPTGNRTGSVKVMYISTGKLVSLDQFKILPMPLSVITRLNKVAFAEGKKIPRRVKPVANVEEGLQKGDEPTCLRPTQESAATADPAVAANPYLRLDLGEGEQTEYEFDPAMVNDVIGYPEDYDTPSEVTRKDFNMKELDVGEIQEFVLPETAEYCHPDTSVPCIPPMNTPEQTPRSVSWADRAAGRSVGTTV